MQCVLAPKDLHKTLAIPSDLELKPGNLGILQGCQCQGGEGCAGVAPAQCQGEAECRLVSHRALRWKWAGFCAAHISMKESTGETASKRLKSNRLSFPPGKGTQPISCSLQISLNKQNIALGATEPAKHEQNSPASHSFLHPSARVALGSMGCHPRGCHSLMGWLTLGLLLHLMGVGGVAGGGLLLSCVFLPAALMGGVRLGSVERCYIVGKQHLSGNGNGRRSIMLEELWVQLACEGQESSLAGWCP